MAFEREFVPMPHPDAAIVSDGRGPDRLPWRAEQVAPLLSDLVRRSRKGSIPAYYSCNAYEVWPSVGFGLSAPHERFDMTGQNPLLDQIVSSVRRRRHGGGRLYVDAAAAVCALTDRPVLEWEYVAPSLLAAR
jgi:hypothetical protein